MSIEDFLARTLRKATILHVGPGTEDVYGDATSAPAGSDTYDAWLVPTDSVEILIGRDTVITNLLLVLPPGATVGSEDGVEMDDGSRFEVVGRPVRASRPGAEDHVECHVREVRG